MTEKSSRVPWQTALAEMITDPAELLQLLDLDPALLAPAQQTSKLFPLRVPRGFVARMERGNCHDPLLRQVLPLGAELKTSPGYVTDPLLEADANPIPGLLHKYPGRVLLTVVGNCAINCRYCFRRHFPYADNNPGKQGWRAILDYITADKNITEVILSGGDPLLANDKTLRELIDQLASLPQLKTLRIHTRLPIVIPERITPELLQILTQHIQLRNVLVTHTNHAQELDQSVTQALQKLRQANITLLNQAVLLRGINDTVESLLQLSERLFDDGVLPYYLHLLDKVQGAAHFAVSERKAKQLIKALSQRLPGYLVPKLVKEVGGELSKLKIM